LEKLVISLASLSFLKQRSCSLTGFWLKLIFFGIGIIDLDLIEHWLILIIFSLSLE
jgi:hypothetical protein